MFSRLPRPALLCLSLLALACPAFPAGAQTVPDPIGDTFGIGPIQHDITSIQAEVDSGHLIFTLNFLGPIAPPSAFAPDSLGGYIDLDTDQNPATGVISTQGIFGPPPSPILGSDYLVDLFFDASVPGQAAVFNTTTFAATGFAPILWGTNSLMVTIPLAFLGNDDGLVNYGAIVGTFAEPTDEIPNGAAPLSTPEPGSLALLAGLGVAGGSLLRRRRARR